MIKQITSKEIENYIKNNPKCVLLDVRTELEWAADGTPDGEKLGIKTHFLSNQFPDKSFNAEALNKACSTFLYEEHQNNNKFKNSLDFPALGHISSGRGRI